MREVDKPARQTNQASFDEGDPARWRRVYELVKESALSKTTVVNSFVIDIASEIVEPEEPRMMPELRRMVAALGE